MAPRNNKSSDTKPAPNPRRLAPENCGVFTNRERITLQPLPAQIYMRDLNSSQLNIWMLMGHKWGQIWTNLQGVDHGDGVAKKHFQQERSMQLQRWREKNSNFTITSRSFKDKSRAKFEQHVKKAVENLTLDELFTGKLGVVNEQTKKIMPPLDRDNRVEEANGDDVEDAPASFDMPVPQDVPAWLRCMVKLPLMDEWLEQREVIFEAYFKPAFDAWVAGGGREQKLQELEDPEYIEPADGVAATPERSSGSGKFEQDIQITDDRRKQKTTATETTQDVEQAPHHKRSRGVQPGLDNAVCQDDQSGNSKNQAGAQTYSAFPHEIQESHLRQNSLQHVDIAHGKKRTVVIADTHVNPEDERHFKRTRYDQPQTYGPSAPHFIPSSDTYGLGSVNFAQHFLPAQTSYGEVAAYQVPQAPRQILKPTLRKPADQVPGYQFGKATYSAAGRWPYLPEQMLGQGMSDHELDNWNVHYQQIEAEQPNAQRYGGGELASFFERRNSMEEMTPELTPDTAAWTPTVAPETPASDDLGEEAHMVAPILGQDDEQVNGLHDSEHFLDALQGLFEDDLDYVDRTFFHEVDAFSQQDV